MSVPLEQIPAPHDASALTLVDQLVQWARRRVDERVFRPGMRMPSIRKLALDKGVSRFTVVEAYERLVAQGFLESRRGSGFYVRERHGGGAAELTGADFVKKVVTRTRADTGMVPTQGGVNRHSLYMHGNGRGFDLRIMFCEPAHCGGAFEDLTGLEFSVGKLRHQRSRWLFINRHDNPQNLSAGAERR